MKRGRIQAKDVDDVAFLRAVRAVQERDQKRLIRRQVAGGFYRDHLPWATWGAYEDEYDSERAIKFRREYGPFVSDYFRGIPRKVLRAKGQRLIDRGLMTGCMCGCRGDMELTDAGLALIGVGAPA